MIASDEVSVSKTDDTLGASLEVDEATRKAKLDNLLEQVGSHKLMMHDLVNMLVNIIA